MDDLLARTGVTRKELNRPLREDHRNDIAVRIGKDWESLATFIGVAPQDVYDIIEVYPPENPAVSPRDRRLALMRRWEELYGSEATYLKLIQGLEQLGRRDLSELLIRLATQVSGSQKQQTPVIQHIKAVDWSNLLKKGGWYVLLPVIVMFSMIMFTTSVGNVAGTYFFGNSNVVPEHYESTYKGNRTSNSSESSHDLIQLGLAAGNTSNNQCNSGSLPDSDLPVISSIFVGRERDLEEVYKKAQNVHIVNINGAPGFGKSFLAVHTGYEIIKNGTPVRYINIEDKLAQFQIPVESTKQDGFNKDDYDFHREPVWSKKTTALTKAIKFTLTIPLNTVEGSEPSKVPLIEELLKWSEGISCTTVLILDNCDDILSSSIREEFMNQVNLLIQHSHYNLHVVIVSQEKLVLLDWFDRWTVKELNMTSSITLLEKLAPGIDHSHAKTVAELVGGYPLALKVVGQLLHTYGDLLTQKLKEELEQNPIDVLDQASIRKQQFRAIMNVVFKRLEELKECGYAVSLFPGSFSWEAGTAILPHSPEKCLNLFTKHSLLEEYIHGYYHHRYKMHRLIREYFVEKVSNIDKTDFQEKFHLYYEKLLLKFATNSTLVGESEWHMLTLEEHNIFLYLHYVLSLEGPLSVDQLIILGFSVGQKWVTFRDLQKFSDQFMEASKLTSVCDSLDPVTCGELYSSAVSYLYQKCKCQSFKGYLRSIFHRPCLQVFSCDAIFKLNRTESIWVQLPEPGKEFIDRLMRYNCYSTVDCFLSFTLWSSLILAQLANAVTVKRRYFVLLLISIALIEDCFYLFHESEPMVFIEMIPRMAFCHILPATMLFFPLVLLIYLLSDSDPKRNFQVMKMVILMTMSGFVASYIIFHYKPFIRYGDYTIFCPLLPICY